MEHAVYKLIERMNKKSINVRSMNMENIDDQFESSNDVFNYKMLPTLRLHLHLLLFYLICSSQNIIKYYFLLNIFRNVLPYRSVKFIYLS